MATLSEEEVRSALSDLEGWELAEGDTPAVTREFQLATFRDAVAFVVRLSYDAEAADHHPDLDVRYNRVKVTLSTHSEGGVTEKDVALAKAIDQLSTG